MDISLSFEETRERNLKEEINRALLRDLGDPNFDIEEVKKVARMFYYEGYKKGSLESYDRGYSNGYGRGYSLGYDDGIYNAKVKDNKELA